MATLKFILNILVMLFFLLVGIVFLFRNQSPASVDFLLMQSPEFGIGFWVLVSFIFGVLIGLFLALPARLAQKFKIKVLNRKLSVSSSASSTGLAKVEPQKGQ